MKARLSQAQKAYIVWATSTGTTQVELAKLLGVSQPAISGVLARAGAVQGDNKQEVTAPKERPSNWSDETKATILEMYMTDPSCSLRVLAKLFDTSANTIQRLLDAHPESNMIQRLNQHARKIRGTNTVLYSREHRLTRGNYIPKI